MNQTSHRILKSPKEDLQRPSFAEDFTIGPENKSSASQGHWNARSSLLTRSDDVFCFHFFPITCENRHRHPSCFFNHVVLQLVLVFSVFSNPICLSQSPTVRMNSIDSKTYWTSLLSVLAHLLSTSWCESKGKRRNKNLWDGQDMKNVSIRMLLWACPVILSHHATQVAVRCTFCDRDDPIL